MPTDNERSNEVLWGAAEIGEFLNMSERRVYHLVEKSLLPVGRLKGRLFARPERLIDHLDRLADGDPEGGAA